MAGAIRRELGQLKSVISAFAFPGLPRRLACAIAAVSSSYVLQRWCVRQRSCDDRREAVKLGGSIFLSVVEEHAVRQQGKKSGVH